MSDTNLNSKPIYTGTPDIQFSAPILAVATNLYDGAGTLGTDIYVVWRADATSGGYLDKIRVKYQANATTTSAATVVKFFLTSVASGAVTAANCVLIDEVAIPATGSLTTTATNPTYDVPMGFAVPAGYAICAKTTVAQPASCGLIATGIGGKY